jgi:hypothetical protein
MQRHRFKNTLTFPDRLAQEAERFRQEAETKPPGQERDNLLKKARQAETAAHIDQWIDSPDCSRRPKAASVGGLFHDSLGDGRRGVGPSPPVRCSSMLSAISSQTDANASSSVLMKGSSACSTSFRYLAA